MTVATTRDPSSAPSTARESRADALVGKDLPTITRAHVRLVRKSLEPGLLDQALRLGQRTFGCNWIEICTRNIRQVHGRERLGALDANKSYVIVSNHRSFFDMYVITAYLVKRGLPHRILFPVRANFFYDRPLGIFVNGVMSFFAMYPPVFRERKQAHLNLASLDETSRLLRQGGMFVGLHPEGKRNTSDDPYALLPAQSGVGRIIHQAHVEVLPVFINGLGNDLPRQVAGNFNRKGNTINVVFGAPVDFGKLLDNAPSPRVFKQIADRTLEAVRVLGEEERALRAAQR